MFHNRIEVSGNRFLHPLARWAELKGQAKPFRFCGRLGLWLVLITLFTLLTGSVAAAADQPRLKILCGVYPIYLFTRNIVQSQDGVQVDLMLPANLGCPHDYALTPQDMAKISQADVFIAQGLGLEEFLGPSLRKANSKIKVIEAAAGIKDVKSSVSASPSADSASGTSHSRSPGHNPHLFASPRLAAMLVRNIAKELANLDPTGGARYINHGQTYAAGLEKLAADMAEAGRYVKNRRIVTQHEIFDYLAKDMGLAVVAVVEEVPGQEPAAAEMLKIVKLIKTSNAAVVFIEPQYPPQVAQTIAKEAGVPVAVLDPVASGPQNALMNHYETVMRKNLEIIKATLGYRAP